MGRDSYNMQNKFLNWWTALEYLARSGESGSIIESVEKRLIPALVLDYVAKHLESYADALSFCGVAPTGAAQATHGIDDYRRLGPPDLFALFLDGAETSHMLTSLTEHPAVALVVGTFAQEIHDPKGLVQVLRRHERHLRWHVHRLYRIRCDIVHSAEYTVSLTLLCANLEYYLKALLSIVLRELQARPAVSGLGELFDRIDFTYREVMQDLGCGNADSFRAVLREGLT